MSIELNEDKLMSKDEMYAILDKVVDLCSDKSEYWVSLIAVWQGSTRWARNRIGVCSNRFEYLIMLNVTIDGGYGHMFTNQLDDESLKNMVEYVEWRAMLTRNDQNPDEFPLSIPKKVDAPAVVWSDASANYSFLDSGKIVQLSCAKAEELSLYSAGYIDCTIGASAYYAYNQSTQVVDKDYNRFSRGQCSITARNPAGQGSGWAGKSEIDFDKIDEEAIAAKAFDKCVASMNPVRIEPGRYTTILEPQAVATLVGNLLFADWGNMNRTSPETEASGPFALGYDEATGLLRTKLGLKVFDERVNVWHDPSDPELGVLGFMPGRVGMRPVTWVKDGVLTSLAYGEDYAVNRLGVEDHNEHRASFRMSGGTSSIEDMISTTERGILVSRFSDINISHKGSMMATGLTRDGLWLIENGKIKHAIRNFRTLESPLFILNNLEQLGTPTKVFSFSPMLTGIPEFSLMMGPQNFAPLYIVPPLKVKDFSFASTIDAI